MAMWARRLRQYLVCYFVRHATAFTRVIVALRAFIRSIFAQDFDIRLLHGPLSVVLIQLRDQFRQLEFVRLRFLAKPQTENREFGGSFFKPIRLVYAYLSMCFLGVDVELLVRAP